MRRLRLMAIVLLAGTLSWAGLRAQQEVLPRPGPGSGVMDVRVVNQPAVIVEPTGEWKVAVARMPDVRISAGSTVGVRLPAFVSKGAKFLVTWPNGEIDKITITEPGEDGWVQVENTGRSLKRWVNLRIARAIEEAR